MMLEELLMARVGIRKQMKYKRRKPVEDKRVDLGTSPKTTARARKPSMPKLKFMEEKK